MVYHSVASGSGFQQIATATSSDASGSVVWGLGRNDPQRLCLFPTFVAPRRLAAMIVLCCALPARLLVGEVVVVVFASPLMVLAWLHVP
jgi:hypothetical protein